MRKYKIYEFIELSSLVMVLSYLLLHNIYIVITGVIIAIWSLNREKIVNFIKSYEYVSIEKDEIKNTSIKESKKEILIEEESRLSLVEEIEEFGFIPSQRKSKDNQAA